MNYQSMAYDAGLAHYLILDLAGRKGGIDRGPRAASMGIVTGQVMTGDDYAAVGDSPRWSSYFCDGIAIISILGAESFDVANPFFLASQRPVRDWPGGFNAHSAKVALEIYTQVMATAPIGVSNVILSGYSFGGTVAQAMAALIGPLQGAQKLTCVTFGSPRCFSNANRRGVSPPWDLVRWMAPFDPVVHFPPHADEAAVATALTTQQIRDTWSACVHLGLGQAMLGGLTPVDIDVPLLQRPITDINLWSWLFALDVPAVDAHSLGTYAAAIDALVIPGQTRDFTPPVLPGPLGQPLRGQNGIIMQPADIALAITGAVNAVAAARGGQPDESPFHAVKVNGIWACYYGQDFVASGTGRRTAQAMASRLNGAWRQWNKTKLASSSTLQFAIQQAFLS
jgi:Lipase (class 3)